MCKGAVSTFSATTRGGKELAPLGLVLDSLDQFTFLKSKLSFQSSALAITLEPSKTTVKGHLRLEAGNQVEVAGSDDNMT